MGATADPAKELMMESGRVEGRPDVELGSLATNEQGYSNEFESKYPISIVSSDLTEQKRPIEAHTKKVLAAKDGDDNAMGNEVYGHVTRTLNGSGQHQQGAVRLSNRSESTTLRANGRRDSTNKRQSPDSSQHSRPRERNNSQSLASL